MRETRGLPGQVLQPLDARGVTIDRVEHRTERAGVPLEELLDRRIGRLGARRRQQGSVAMRDEQPRGARPSTVGNPSASRRQRPRRLSEPVTG